MNDRLPEAHFRGVELPTLFSSTPTLVKRRRDMADDPKLPDLRRQSSHGRPRSWEAARNSLPGFYMEVSHVR